MDIIVFFFLTVKMDIIVNPPNIIKNHHEDYKISLALVLFKEH